MPVDIENEVDMNTTLDEFLDMIVKLKQKEIQKLTEDHMTVCELHCLFKRRDEETKTCFF